VRLKSPLSFKECFSGKASQYRNVLKAEVTYFPTNSLVGRRLLRFEIPEIPEDQIIFVLLMSLGHGYFFASTLDVYIFKLRFEGFASSLDYSICEDNSQMQLNFTFAFE